MMSIEDVSGPGRQLAALATELGSRGVDMRVLLFHRRGHPCPPFARYLDAAGVENAIIADNGRLDIRLPGRAVRVLRAWAPDVLQTHGYKATAVAWVLRRRGERTPWIGFFHGSTAESARAHLYHWADRRMLASADRAVVMSERHLGEFARCGDRVRVIHNAVIDLPATDSACGDEALAPAAAAARPVVGVVGRLSPEKGVDLFLDACAQLVREGLRFTALIAGNGPEERSLKERCSALGLDARVFFLGHVDAVQRLYPQLDVLVIPSRSEGLPNVLLEALAADVRVVSTRVGAVPEVLVDSAAGTMVPAGDAHALAGAMRTAIVSPPSDREAAARSEVVDRFSLARRADAHLALYDGVRGVDGRDRAPMGTSWRIEP